MSAFEQFVEEIENFEVSEVEASSEVDELLSFTYSGAVTG